MELVFLGTGAGMPSRQRNVTAVALDLLAENGTCWLFDCGEGTQHQILRSSLKISKLEKLFITHLHGDHIYGIPGLLASLSYQGVTSPFTVFGPQGIKLFIETTLSLSQARLSYPLEIIEISEGCIYKDDLFTVEAACVEHRLECFGFRIIEQNRPGRLDVKRLKKLGVIEGPVFGQLKKGQTVLLENGTALKGEDFLGPEQVGRKLAIIGDTRRCSNAIVLSRDVDILVHEATFSVQQQDLAQLYFHSTTIDAALTAKEANAKKLIMTHFSSRYQEEDMAMLLSEAQDIFPNSHVANDFANYSIQLEPNDHPV